jgi:hypothetical protein
LFRYSPFTVLEIYFNNAVKVCGRPCKPKLSPRINPPSREQRSLGGAEGGAAARGKKAEVRLAPKTQQNSSSPDIVQTLVQTLCFITEHVDVVFLAAESQHQLLQRDACKRRLGVSSAPAGCVLGASGTFHQ